MTDGVAVNAAVDGEVEVALPLIPMVEGGGEGVGSVALSFSVTAVVSGCVGVEVCGCVGPEVVESETLAGLCGTLVEIVGATEDCGEPLLAVASGTVTGDAGVWVVVVVAGFDAVDVGAAVVVAGSDAVTVVVGAIVVVVGAIVVVVGAIVVVVGAIVVVVVVVVVVGAIVVVVVVVGAAVVKGVRPNTKLLPTHAPDPDAGTGASSRNRASGSVLVPCTHVSTLPNVVKATVQFQYSTSPVDSSTVTGTMLPTVMAAGGLPAKLPFCSTV
jgi:hypothetical protein